MRLVSFAPEDEKGSHLGILQDAGIIDIPAAWEWARNYRQWPAGPAPKSIIELIERDPRLSQTRQVVDILLTSKPPKKPPLIWEQHSVSLLPPIGRPPTIRDFYAFEEHVRHANNIRQQPIPQEWYQFPVFYYSNPGSIFGTGADIPYPKYSNELDFELEVAFVIGKTGKDIPKESAGEYLFGLMIMNDWSARDIQRAEMRVRLGPAKSKDFATSIGPWLVTIDELEDRVTHRVGVFDLEMTAKVNGKEVTKGNLKDIYYSFADMIGRASAECTLHPGDIFGSGTVGNGCLLELTQSKGPWLKPGDIVDLEIDCLGSLRNQVVR